MAIWKREFLTPKQKWKLYRFWQTHRGLKILIYFIILFIAGIIIGKCITPVEIKEIVKEKPVEKVVEVEKGLISLAAFKVNIVGAYGDNLQWRGFNIRQYNGTMSLKVNPDNKIGSLVIEFEGSINPDEDAILDGKLKFVMTEFSGKEDWQNGGIAKDILLFGDTGRGFEYLPKTKAELAGFGKANLYLNDQLVFDNLEAIFAYTDGIRKPNGKIAKPNGDLYNLNEKSSVEFFDAGEKEFHFMVYMDDYDRANFPNKALFINMYFEDVVKS